MKRILVITDGHELRAFRLKSVRGGYGLQTYAEEIRVSIPASERKSTALLENAVFGERAPRADRRNAVWEGESLEGRPSPNEPNELREKMSLQLIAETLEGMVRKENPHLWNLVAPAELSSELREVLAAELMEKLARVEMADLLEISAEQVEERFRPFGGRHEWSGMSGKRNATAFS